MTYCVAMRLETGLVFLSDSRTNAGVDHVSSIRKMTVFENPGDRLMVLMTAGNLAISQSIRQILMDQRVSGKATLWNATSMHQAVQIVGDAVRAVYERDSKSLASFGIDFNVSLLLGGQIRGERCRLFQVYSAGNFIEAEEENPYFQIGEAKYGKPILDRVVTPAMSLDEGAKCALVSMDSTLRSNISVGLPLDLLVYENDELAVNRFVTIDEHNQYFKELRTAWGRELRKVFENIQAPPWIAAPASKHAVTHASRRGRTNAASVPVRAPLPAGVAADPMHPAPHQTLAYQDRADPQAD